MNGGHALIRTLVNYGVDTCFMNPGTSGMHRVAAFDAAPEMRSVLAVFEGGHATHHKQYDAQLESDIETVARNVSTFIHWSASPDKVGADVADAVSAATSPPGQVATLVLPADVSWSEGGVTGRLPAPARPAAPSDAAIAEIATALPSGEPAGVLVGGRAGRAALLAQASGIAAATGAKLLYETFPTRLERGAGRAPVNRLAYLTEFDHLQPPAVPSPRPPRQAQDGRTTTSAGAGSAPTAPVPADHHAERAAR
jgi:acetolactate synthase-1/2/3 large subunit